MQRNFYLRPQSRLAEIFQEKKTGKDHFFYLSRNKLQCLFDYHFSVPNKRLRNSRFFLNKAVDKLVYPNLQK